MRTLVTHRRALLVITAAVSFPMVEVVAQTTTQTTPITARPTFEVISIKRNTSASGESSMRQMPNGGFILVNSTVRTLIGRAYPGFSSDPIGLPSWTAGEHYDVNATASLKNPTIEDRQAMMRAMLAERFTFAAHMETQEQPAFDLVLARRDGKLGPGLKPSEVDCAARAAAQRAAADAARASGAPPPPPAAFTPPTPGSPVPPCNMRMTGNMAEGDTTMAGLTSLIRSMAGRYVVDKTGLKGSYRLKLEAVRLFQGPGPDPTASGPDDTPSIFTALQEQLGLKLESSRAQVEVLVVDHIERPTED